MQVKGTFLNHATLFEGLLVSTENLTTPSRPGISGPLRAPAALNSYDGLPSPELEFVPLGTPTHGVYFRLLETKQFQLNCLGLLAAVPCTHAVYFYSHPWVELGGSVLPRFREALWN